MVVVVVLGMRGWNSQLVRHYHPRARSVGFLTTAISQTFASPFFLFSPQKKGNLTMAKKQQLQQQHQHPIQDPTQFFRREHELLAIVTGKEKELELLRSSNTLFRRQLAEKESEVDRARHNLLLLDHHTEAELKRKLSEEVRRREKVEKRLAETTVKARADLDAVLVAEERKREEVRAAAWREFERALAHEEAKCDDVRRKAKENLDHIIAEEEKRRADLTRRFTEKVESLQREKRAAETLAAEKQQLEQRLQSTAQESSQATQAAQTQKEANQELVEMVTKLTTRLAEEKKRNRRLEAKIDQITVDALNNVSQAKRQYQDLKNQFEDRESRVDTLQSEVAAVKREKDAMRDAWTEHEAEMEASHQSALAQRDELVRNLEAETALTRTQLEERQRNLEECQRNLEECQRNLEEALCIARAPPPSPPPPTPILIDHERELLSVRTDLELYRQDIKAYKHDVKKRDAQIREQSRTIALLQQQLPSPTSPSPPSPPSPPSSSSSPIDSSSDDSSNTDEVSKLKKKLRHADAAHESLRRKHNAFVAQQSMVIADLDRTILRLRRERAKRSIIPPFLPPGKQEEEEEEEGEVIEW